MGDGTDHQLADLALVIAGLLAGLAPLDQRVVLAAVLCELDLWPPPAQHPRHWPPPGR